MTNPNHAILLVSCRDQRGITAAVTDFVYRHNGNIVHADQHIDAETDTFFMRVEWSLDGFSAPKERIKEAFRPVADRFAMSHQLYFTDRPVRAAIFVSKQLHCLQDLLWRVEAGQLDCEVPLIISNHSIAARIAEDYDIPFHLIEITPQNKTEQERQQIKLIEDLEIDLIILARYHQILSPDFTSRYPQRIINIHHSFLPAFAGGRPYHQAFAKGVKIIGATSHYVTETLDEGPIIEQDTARVSHRDDVEDMIRKGEDLERVVLYRAVRWHTQRKILCYGNKTVVFD